MCECDRDRDGIARRVRGLGRLAGGRSPPGFRPRRVHVKPSSFAITGLWAFLVVGPSGKQERFVKVVTGEHLYPGHPVYLMIDGQRFAGEEHIPIAALKGGQEAHVEWTPWPSGGREERVMDLDGFGAAYDECVAEIERLRLQPAAPGSLPGAAISSRTPS
jgi:hypothetical protein